MHNTPRAETTAELFILIASCNISCVVLLDTMFANGTSTPPPSRAQLTLSMCSCLTVMSACRYTVGCAVDVKLFQPPDELQVRPMSVVLSRQRRKCALHEAILHLLPEVDLVSLTIVCTATPPPKKYVGVPITSSCSTRASSMIYTTANYLNSG